jgi:hypothetical protein
MQTAPLDEIIRGKDPALKQAVEQLAHGQVREAIDNLARQGRVHEIGDRQHRLQAIAKAYAGRPDGRLVVSRDNPSRHEINERVHRELQCSGKVEQRDYRLTVLVPGQEMTGADRQWAAQNEPSDIVRYTRGGQAVGVTSGEYVYVTSADRKQNFLAVERENGQQLTYDPQRLHGLSIYREKERDFSSGDRVQFTAPYRDEYITNRQLGTVEQIDAEGKPSAPNVARLIRLCRDGDTKPTGHPASTSSPCGAKKWSTIPKAPNPWASNSPTALSPRLPTRENVQTSRRG